MAGPSRSRSRATSGANLGAGDDYIGLALDLVDLELEVEVLGSTRGGVDLSVEGEGADELPAGMQNRSNRSRRSAPDRRGDLPEGVGWRVGMTNPVTLARGLGSSAAATIGGLVAGNALSAKPLARPRSCCSWRPTSRAIRTTPRRRCLVASSCRPDRRRCRGRPLRRPP